jgi:tocopherol O-methyltransferase
MIGSNAPATLAQVADHYDDLDPFYRALWGEHVHHGYWETGGESPDAAVLALIDRLASRLSIGTRTSVCDIGCGYGATALHLASRYGASVTGVTLSKVQATRAEGMCAATPAIHIRCEDWLSNALPSERFDVAIAIESSEHMADKARFFSEAFRVLRPGGRLGVCAWLAADAPSRMQRRHLLEPICREGRMPSLGAEVDYVAAAEIAGFRDVRVEDVTSRVRRTWWICTRRLVHAVATDRRVRAYLRDPSARHREFALTFPRLIAAYATGAMRYGVLTAVRPA